MCIVIFRRWIFRRNELKTLGHPCVDRNIFKRNQRNLDHLVVLSILVSDPSKFSMSENNIAHLRASNLKYALIFFFRINDADTVRLVVKGSYWILMSILPVIFCLCTCKIRRRLLERSFLKIMSVAKNLRDRFHARKFHYYSPISQTPQSESKQDDDMLKA